MQVGDYSLQVEGKTHSPEGYVQMRHREQYSLRIKSHTSRRSDVAIKIDGEEVGVWRLDPRVEFTLNRGVNDRGIFTFFLAGSEEASRAGLAIVPANNLGLITATFTPEIIRPIERSYRASSGFRSFSRGSAPDIYESKLLCSTQNMAGGTGLTGRSDQEFTNAINIQYDYTVQVTINLRLIGDANEVRPKVASYPRSNPVPAPVGV